PRPPDPAPARNRRRRAGEGLLLLERHGQPGVDGRLRQPLRAGVRGLQDAEAYAEDERILVPRGSPAQCSRLSAVVVMLWARRRVHYRRISDRIRLTFRASSG